MFYSHEILTSREGGLATVWLVATLGSKSNLKKVNRKAILDVNVPKTCDIIIHPEAPMALRLQSNLLYGVSRVYSQQYGYVLSDAQLAHSNMQALLRAVRTSELDPNAGKARPEQLRIEDDPAFSPDAALPGLDFDLSALDFSTEESSRRSSILSPHSQRSSLSSQQSGDVLIPRLEIPSSGSGRLSGFGGFQLPSEHGSSAQRNERFGRLLEDDDKAFDNDPGFSIDAEGNLIEDPIGESEVRRESFRLGSDSAASARVRQELAQNLRQGLDELEAMNFDFDLPHFNNEDELLPNAELFPAMAADDSTGTGELRLASQPREDQGSLESAEAHLRRRRPKLRAMRPDQRQELHSSDITAWTQNYIKNMAEATLTKRNHQAPSLAKKKAALWVMGLGIGGVGVRLGSSSLTSPLAFFAGDAMMELLTGLQPAARRKRARGDDSEDETGSEARRTRIREGEGQEAGLGDEMMLPLDDDMRIEAGDDIEVGRHGATPLPDDPTFPWNTTASALASRHGSSIARGQGHGFASSIGGFPTSAAGPPSLPGMPPGSLGGRGSRITSASPLTGRGGHRYSSLEAPIGDGEDFSGPARSASDEAYQAFDNDDYDSFQLHGPGAGIGTQTVAQSQWMTATLDREANNFLEFVKAEIAALQPPAPEAEGAIGDVDEDDELSPSAPAAPKSGLDFEQLLPPGQHSAIVAAQALHHVLALATKGLVDVEQQQKEPFAAIRLSLPSQS